MDSSWLCHFSRNLELELHGRDFLAKRGFSTSPLLDRGQEALPAVADGDVFPGSCVNQMKREQLFPLACVGQEMGRNKPEL